MVRNVINMYRRVYAGLPREVWMLSGALFINRFGTMVLPFLALYLRNALGFRESAVGWMLGLYGIGSVFGAYMGGRLIPVVGAIRLQIVALLLSVPFFLIIPLWDATWAIAVSLFLLSFCSNAVRPANATALTHYAPVELRMRAFGLQRMALNLGVSFGPVIGGVLSTIGFVWLFVVDAGTTFLCALSLIWFFGIRRQWRTEPADAQRDAGESAARSPLTDPMFVLFLTLLILSALVFMQVNITYPLFLSDQYGLSKPAIGLIFAVNTVVIVVFEMLLLDVVRRWSMIRVIGCGGFLSCLGFGILPFGDSVGFCVFSMLIITVGEMLWMPVAMVWAAQRSDRGNRGMYMSYCTITFSVASILAPTLGAAIYQFDRNLTWYISIGIGVVVLLGSQGLHHLLKLEATKQAADGGRPEGGLESPCAEPAQS